MPSIYLFTHAKIVINFRQMYKTYIKFHTKMRQKSYILTILAVLLQDMGSQKIFRSKSSEFMDKKYRQK